jgi:hypothetical protein
LKGKAMMPNKKPRSEAHREADRKRYREGKNKKVLGAKFSDSEIALIDEMRGNESVNSFIRRKVLGK